MRHLNELSLFLKKNAARRNRLRSNLRSKTERCWFSRNTRKIIIMPLFAPAETNSALLMCTYNCRNYSLVQSARTSKQTEKAKKQKPEKSRRKEREQIKQQRQARGKIKQRGQRQID
jgi:hypothetical protein